MQVKLFSEEEVNSLLKAMNIDNTRISYEHIFDIYNNAIHGIIDLMENNPSILVQGINNYELVQYCLGEYIYTFRGKHKKDIDEILNSEKGMVSISSIVADKYLTLNIFPNSEKRFTSRYLPPISTLKLYITFIQNVVKSYKRNDPSTTLVVDLLVKSLSISQCILSQLLDGYFTEGFALWRTLHECECALVILEKYDEPLIQTYLKHMHYGYAFSNAIKDKEETDKIFLEIKEGMKAHELKSKDMKKYIEYGWLYEVPGVDQLNFKLNFRDGLETLAGLQDYNERYTISSEIIHSTPLLIYSRDEYFYFTTLLCLYESFFRLEKIFVSIFSKRVGTEQLKQYLGMRNVYYEHLKQIYVRESKEFIALQKAQK